MKKLIIIVVVVLLCIAGWAGATYFTSVKVEEQYHGLIEEHSVWGMMTLTAQNYQRGFLSSTAETLLEINVPMPPVEEGEAPGVETVQLVFEHTIYNGPLLIGTGQSGVLPALALIDTRLVIPSDDSDKFEKLLREIPELKDSFAHITIGFDGKAKVMMEVPPFEMQEDDGSLAWGGLTVTSEYAPGPGTLAGSIVLGNVDARFEDGSINWQGVQGDFDLVQVLPMLFVGQSQMVFGGMKVEIENKVSDKNILVQSNELKIASASSYDGHLVHVSQTMTCDGVTIDGETYGPLEFDMELKNMNAQALSDYQQNIMSVYSEIDPLNPDAMLAQLLPLYTDLAFQLMAESPEFNINRFYINTPMGAAQGMLKIKYDNPQQEAPADLASLFQYLPYFDASTDLTVDQSLVKSFLKSSIKKKIQAASANGNQPEMSDLEIEALVNQQIEGQLGMFAAQGFIVREEEKIKSQIIFTGGELSVNGKPMPLSL
jgi:uncharacterized protein YdgA (DUF945 family)